MGYYTKKIQEKGWVGMFTEQLNIALKQPVIPTGGVAGGITSAWKPIAIGGGGLLAGIGLSSLFGGGGTSKKEVTQAAAPQYIAPTITPTQVITPIVTQPSYITTTYNQQDYSSMAITDSPFASISKKTGASTSAEPQWYTPVTGSQETPFTGEQGQELSAAQADGTNMALLAGIAAVGLIGYGYVSRKHHT